MRVLLTLSYVGTGYHGWQVQKNGAATVQQTVQDAVESVFGVRGSLTGCSRTDAGVHAEKFCAMLELPESAPNIPCSNMPNALNRRLPRDISIREAREVGEDFHARYSVKRKTYTYLIDNSPSPSPFLYERSWHIPQRLDESLINRAAKAFIGTHDFAAFMASGSKIEDTCRTVFDCGVERVGGFENDETVIRAVISADGFLYNMVRIIVGTLTCVSEGKIPPEGISAIIESKDRTRAGRTAPPGGLYLTDVRY